MPRKTCRRGFAAISIAVLMMGATLARADLQSGDPNDAKSPDIKSVASNTFRGTYMGTETALLRVSMRFYDKIPWRKIFDMEVVFDSKGDKAPDFSMMLLKNGRKFKCRLVKGSGIVGAGGIVLDETQVVDYSAGARNVDCAIPRFSLKPDKTIRFRTYVVREDFTSDAAPNKGWYSHI